MSSLIGPMHRSNTVEVALKPRPHIPAPLLIVRWIARIASVASLAMLALFATSGGNFPTLGEWLLIAFFPVGVALGMILAWWREILGGGITVGSLVIFYLLMAAQSGKVPTTPWFLVFASPGIALLICGLIASRVQRTTGG